MRFNGHQLPALNESVVATGGVATTLAAASSKLQLEGEVTQLRGQIL